MIFQSATLLIQFAATGRLAAIGQCFGYQLTDFCSCITICSMYARASDGLRCEPLLLFVL